jgi:predicted O-methyltransferase YrrM
MLVSTSVSWVVMAFGALGAAGQAPEASAAKGDRVQAVIDDVDRDCRHRYVYMIGPQKAKRLAELVRERKPKTVVECGTAIGYSGLWIARELKAQGAGAKLITVEIDPSRAREARDNFRRAGLDDVVEVRVADAREIASEIPGPIDFLFLDCDFENYDAVFRGLEPKLADGAVVVADNAGVAPNGMAPYLQHVRSRHSSRTEWFDLDLPWSRRDAMEITTIRRAPNAKPGSAGIGR